MFVTAEKHSAEGNRVGNTKDDNSMCRVIYAVYGFKCEGVGRVRV